MPLHVIAASVAQELYTELEKTHRIVGIAHDGAGAVFIATEPKRATGDKETRGKPQPTRPDPSLTERRPR